jgi:hypothetical protein
MGFRNKITFLLAAALVCGDLLMKAGNGGSRECRRLLKEAHGAREDGDHYQAWRLYRQVLTMDPKNERASVYGAESLFYLNYPIDSASVLQGNLAFSRMPAARYYLAKIRHRQGAYDEAISLLNDYKSIPAKRRGHTEEEISYLMTRCENAKKFTSSPMRSVIRNIGPEINSKYADYVPVILPDESALYFTSKRENPVHPAKNGDNTYFEDVYVSYRVDEKWKPAESIGFPVNTETNDGCVAISPDGQRMIVYRTSPDRLSGDLYLSMLGKSNRWNALELMPAEINSKFIETSACFSTDTSDIYFSSDRPGGYGGKDIYRIRKLPNGRWGAPYNLGKKINTKYDEDAPFLHPDGVSLYFSSKGHDSMGEYDVFSAKLNDDRTDFSTPENLGYPINDAGNDIFFVLSADCQRGYYSSVKKESLGDIDIYEIETRFGENDLKVRHAKVYLGDVPGRARVTLVDMEDGQVNGNYFSNPDHGRLIMVVNPLKRYQATIEADGYMTQERIIEPLTFEKDEEKFRFTLQPENAQ